MRVGAHYVAGECEFAVWAPHRSNVSVVLSSNDQMRLKMEKATKGYWKVVTRRVAPGSKYKYLLNEKIERPDPASHFQPEGVYGPSEVVDHEAYAWGDRDWRGIPPENMILYELHIGTFTHEGTFDSALSRLRELADLGVNAVEIMPVAQFVGGRNWGYDPVYPYAVQNSYGGPDGLKRFVDECHTNGLAVVLDIIFNHVGLEGNYLSSFAPYFTEKHRTLWGPAIRFDGPSSAQVRDYFLECALHLLKNYHLDGLRLDAVHAIFDSSPKHFLQELAETVRAYSSTIHRKICLIAESDLNDSKVVRPVRTGGFGMDAQWLDDFHHSLHALLTGEKTGYFADFGSTKEILKALREGYVYSGQYSKYRKRKHGCSSTDVPPSKFVVFSQNHDQVGNRLFGERLIRLVGLEGAKLAAGIVILSPYVPLLFMGEEYGEITPFLYFTSYQDEGLAQMIKKGRKAEFAKFNWQTEPPDPQSVRTYEQSTVGWNERYRNKGKRTLGYYKELIRLRTRIPAFDNPKRNEMRFFMSEDETILFMNRWKDKSEVAIVANFSKQPTEYRFPFEGGSYQKMLDSADIKWNGPGSTVPCQAACGGRQRINGLSLVVFIKASKSEE